MIAYILGFSALALLGVFGFLFYDLIKKNQQALANARFLEIQNEKARNTTNLRLQAYERLMILSDRIAIPSLIARLRTEGASANDFRYALLIAIRQEFEHNSTQQIYVSEKLWQIMLATREFVSDIITHNADSLDANADANALANALFSFLAEQKTDALAAAKRAIREEAANLL